MNLADVYGGLNECVIVLGADGRYHYLNPSAEAFVARSTAELEGRHFLEVFPELAGSPFAGAFERAATAGETSQFEMLSSRRDRWFDSQVFRSTVGVVVVARDVTSRKRALELSERLLGIVGHDLRSPLAAIVTGAAVLLRRGALSEPDAKTVTRIARSASRMTSMIDQLLDYTRARLGGGIVIERAPTDLGELAREVIEELELAHPGLAVEYAPEGDTAGVWDRERLGQVLSNLIGNAHQHGADGKVAVRLRGGGEELTIEVRNPGAPIPPEVLPTIFEPFRNHDTAHKRESLGLGLFISRELVAGHGGTISVCSTENDGTTFTVRLPRRR